MRKKTNQKLYALAVIPVVAILYFLTANPIQDNSMWDISTNEYIQRGADFELFAMTCSPYWSESFKKTMGCDEPTSTPTPSSPPSTVDYTGDFYCKSNVVMSYNDDVRQRWIQYGDTWRDVDLNLASTLGGGKVDEIKGVINMKCDWNGNGSVKLLSGNVGTFVLNGWNGGSYTIPKINDYLMPNTKLENGVKTEVGVINILESDIDKIEKMLSVDSSNNVGITFTVDIDSKFLLNGIDTVNSKSIHQSSMKFTKLLEEVKVVTQANSRYFPITIESIERTAYPALDLMGSSGDKLNTSLDIKKNQIKITTSMTKYLSDEGSPTVEIQGPDGTYKKISARLAEKVGDKQYFETYWTLPLDSKQGTWNVFVKNINRDQSGSSSFYVQNNVQNTVTTTTTTTATTDPDELKDLEDLRVGVMWTAKDGNGGTISGVGGNSITDGNAVIPMLSLDISRITDDRFLDRTTPFSQINIQPIIQFDSDDAFVEMKNYDLQNKILLFQLSIPDDQRAGTIPRQIQMMPQGNGEMLILGFGTLTQSNADTLAETAGYAVGDRFTVEAKIGGNFELTSQKTNNDYQFTFDDVKLTQTFQYGVIGTDLDPSEQKGFDEKWNKCIADGKVPKNLGNLRQECITQEEVQKRQCEDDSEGDAGEWNSSRKMCEVPNMVNGSEVPITSTSSEAEIENAIDSCESVKGQNWDKGTNMCIKITTTETPVTRGDTEPETKITATNGNLQLCGSNQSITECIADLQAPSLLDDNVIIIIVIAITILIVIAIISKRQNRSYGLMNRY